jgi:asparagine synthetase B (glutamine-hydrolysing)
MGSGIDSAAIAGALTRMTGRVTIVTQSMPGAMDEAPGASRTARGLGANHHVFPYEAASVNLVQHLESFVAAVEAPAFWAQLASPILALSGASRHIARSFFLGIMSDNLMEYGSRRSGLRRTAHRVREFVRTSVSRPGSHFDKSYFSSRAALVCSGPLERNLAYSRKNLLADYSANGLAQLFANQWLNVRTTSRLVQLQGGEALLPYLDRDVVCHFMAMPFGLRREKQVLLALLHRYMPKEHAPTRKRGFCANVVRWHHEAKNLGEALDLLTDQRTRWRGLYDATRARKLIELFRRGPVRDARACEALYQWLLFELFCRRFFDRSGLAQPLSSITTAARWGGLERVQARSTIAV